MKQCLFIFRKKDGELKTCTAPICSDATFDYFKDFFKSFDCELLRVFDLDKLLSVVENG